jgi:hypothetical protein
LWVRQFIKNKETNGHSPSYFKENVHKKEYENKGLEKILPLYCELLKEFEKEGKITDKMRKWAIVNLMECSVNLIASFEVYILQSKKSFIQRTRLSLSIRSRWPSSTTTKRWSCIDCSLRGLKLC